jgi:hypothetical protein
MILIAVIALTLMKKTSSAVEKTVLTLTSVLCLLFLLNAMSELGLRWASLPFGHAVFIGLTDSTQWSSACSNNRRRPARIASCYSPVNRGVEFKLT